MVAFEGINNGYDSVIILSISRKIMKMNGWSKKVISIFLMIVE